MQMSVIYEHVLITSNDCNMWKKLFSHMYWIRNWKKKLYENMPVNNNNKNKIHVEINTWLKKYQISCSLTYADKYK